MMRDPVTWSMVAVKAGVEWTAKYPASSRFKPSGVDFPLSEITCSGLGCADILTLLCCVLDCYGSRF